MHKDRSIHPVYASNRCRPKSMPNTRNPVRCLTPVGTTTFSNTWHNHCSYRDNRTNKRTRLMISDSPKEQRMSKLSTAAVNRTRSADSPELGGPHPWQIQPWAKAIRSMLRQREYFRWTDEFCTSLTVKGAHHLDELKGPAIFVPNHQSHMDTPVLMSASASASVQSLICTLEPRRTDGL